MSTKGMHRCANYDKCHKMAIKKLKYCWKCDKKFTKREQNYDRNKN